MITQQRRIVGFGDDTVSSVSRQNVMDGAAHGLLAERQVLVAAPDDADTICLTQNKHSNK